MEMYELCLGIATKAHEGQKRRCGEPYVNHCIRVANSFEDEELKCIAILHDVIEDTSETRESLIARGVDEDIVDCVVKLTHEKGVGYKEYIGDICDYSFWISDSPRRIKIADMIDNLSSNPTERQKKKYFNAILQMVDR